MYEYIIKKKLQELMIKSILFIILGIVNINSKEKNTYLVLAFSILFFLVLKEIISKVGIAHFSKIVLYVYIVIDTTLILFSRLNTIYFLFHVLFFAIFLFFISQAEGIKGLKRGGLLLLVISLLKVVYITFLI